MKKFLCAIISCVVLSAAIFAGCAETPAEEVEVTVKGYQFFAMNTSATLVVYDDFTKQENLDKFNEFTSEVGRLVYNIEADLTSDVDKFNDAEAGESVRINSHTYRVLSTAQSVYELTNGYYNPAVYYNVRAYGFNQGMDKFAPDKDEFPSDEEVAAYKQLYEHFDELEVYPDEHNYFYATKPEYTVEYGGETLSMKLDLGGVGKGYAVDQVNDLMDQYGYTMGYFNFGTSSIAFKTYKGGTPYNLNFTNPRNSSESFAKTPVSNSTVSTSGDYENYFILDEDGDGIKETRYCHVFSPVTGRPIDTGIMSASVVGGSAAENDALTTAIMAMGLNAAITFTTEKLSHKTVIFTYDDGNGYYYYTNMAEGSYEVTSSDYSYTGGYGEGGV